MTPRTLRVAAATVTATLCVIGSTSTVSADDSSATFTEDRSDWELTSDVQRLLDTRDAGARAAPGSVTTVDVPGTGTSLLNVVAVNTAAPGFVTVFDCAQPQPSTSNINYGPRQTVANQVLVSNSTGRVCIYSLAATHLVVDLNATIPADIDPPTRIVDSRVGLGITRLQPGVAVVLPVAASAGDIVVLNVAATNSAGPGWINIDHAGFSRLGSVLNFAPGDTVANLVVVDAEAQIVSSVAVDVVIDLIAVVPSTQHLDDVPPDAPPASIVSSWTDTRMTAPTGEDRYRIKARTPQIIEELDAPIGWDRTDLINLTVVTPAAPGYLVAYPCDSATDPIPTTSSINYAAGVTRAHLTPVDRTHAEHVCVYSLAELQLVVDRHNGWLTTAPASVTFTDPQACNLAGTRIAAGQPVTIARNTTTPPAPFNDGFQFTVLGYLGSIITTASAPPGVTVTITNLGKRRINLTVTAADPSLAPSVDITVGATSSTPTTFTVELPQRPSIVC